MKTNYAHVVEQTYEEKTEMLMKCSKKKLVEMLIESNRHLDLMSSDLNKIGVFRYEDLSDSFKESIDGIEEALNK